MADELSNIRVVGVIGAGTMGSGIAQVVATAGFETRLYDVAEQFLERGKTNIADSLQRFVDRGRMEASERDETLARIHATTRLEQFSDVDFVIEAAPENIELKQDIFGQLDEICGQHTVLATNTSSLSVTEISGVTQRGDRVVGMHFFNPAQLMQLVEVIGGQTTSQAALDAATAMAGRLGKTPVIAKDTPGFIVNRVARPFYLEGLRVLGEGLASVETIDRAIREAAGFRMGPFELMDLIGVDVNLTITESLFEAYYGEARFRPHVIQRSVVRSGQLGRKTGKGFYDYSTTPPTPNYPSPVGFQPVDVLPPWSAWSTAISPSGGAEPGAAAIAGRILVSLINEAALSLQEGVASRHDIDTAMKLGTAYPRGPLEWADELGLDLVVESLEALQRATSPERYQPAALLRSLADRGERFAG